MGLPYLINQSLKPIYMKRIIAPFRQPILTLLLIIGALTIGKFSRGNNFPATRRIHIQDAEVRYIPGKGGDLRFNVLYDNVSGSRFSLTILDGYGNQLYQQTYSDRKFDKVFRLADTDIAGKLTFVIRDFGDNSTQRFEAHAVDHLVEDVEIREVK